MVRNCPKCQVEVRHETEYDYKAALRSSRPCEGCLDVFCLEQGKPVGSLTRRCHRCERKIFYGNFQAKRQADRAAKLCKPCADDDTRSKCRDEGWRAGHTESLKRVWADPDSVFNSSKYRETLSDAQKNVSAGSLANRVAGLKRKWDSYSDDERDARVEALIASSHTEQANIKRGKSLQVWWSTIPVDHSLRSCPPQRREQISNTLKSNPETLDLMQKAIEKSHRTGRASSLESKMAEILLPQGFKQTQRVPGTRFYVDFLNEKTKQVFELYGDFWHCHPRFEESWNVKYGGVNPTTKEVPSERRTKDAERVRTIEVLGYRVTIVWQSELSMWLRDNR